MRIEIYYSGHPAAIKSRLDSDAGTYTEWDVNGVQTLQRALTQQEVTLLASASASNSQVGNQVALRAKANSALTSNIAALALSDPTAANQAYIALNPPTQQQAMAQIDALTQQVDALVAQVTALTQQNNALIRLALGLLDSTSGT